MTLPVRWFRQSPSERRGAGIPELLNVLPAPLRLHPGALGDEVRERSNGGQIACLREPREAERVQRVARQETHVRVHAVERAGLRVVQEIGLANGLDDERAVRVWDERLEGAGSRVGDRVRPKGLVGRGGQLAERAHRAANASRAASSVRSTCSSSWASDGNQASNGDGGG